MTEVHVELLVAGSCRAVAGMAVAGGGLGPAEFPALVAVIRHPRLGITLFDTGYSARFDEATQGFPQRVYRWVTPVQFAPEDTAVAQLRARGVSADEVGHVVISHVHADHVAGLRDFPAARIILSPKELPSGWRDRSGWSQLRHATLPGLLPDDVDVRIDAGSRADLDSQPSAEALDPRHPRAARGPLAQQRCVPTGLPGSLAMGMDICGDGSMLVTDLPGHTPGHQGLYLPRTQGPPVLLVGDACWSRAAYTETRLPPRPVQRFMAEPTAYRAVIADLAQVHRTLPEVLIVPSHCAPSIAAARAELASA